MFFSGFLASARTTLANVGFAFSRIVEESNAKSTSLSMVTSTVEIFNKLLEIGETVFHLIHSVRKGLNHVLIVADSAFMILNSAVKVIDSLGETFDIRCGSPWSVGMPVGISVAAAQFDLKSTGKRAPVILVTAV